MSSYNYNNILELFRTLVNRGVADATTVATTMLSSEDWQVNYDGLKLLIKILGNNEYVSELSNGDVEINHVKSALQILNKQNVSNSKSIVKQVVEMAITLSKSTDGWPSQRQALKYSIPCRKELRLCLSNQLLKLPSPCLTFRMTRYKDKY